MPLLVTETPLKGQGRGAGVIDATAKILCDSRMNHLSQPWPLRAGRKGWLLAALACIALIAGTAVFDAQISHFGQSLPAPVVAVAAVVTQFGESGYLLIPVLGLWLLRAACRRSPAAAKLCLAAAGVFAFVFIGVGLPSLFTTIVKRIIGRGRPALADSVGPFGFEPGSWLNWLQQSFPSGHTTTAFAICFVVSFLVPAPMG